MCSKLLLAIFINAVFNYFLTVLRYSLESVKYTLTNLLYSLSTAGFSIFFVLVQKQGLLGVYYGLIAGGLTGLGLAVYFNSRFLNMTFSIPALKEMLKFSIPLVPSGLGVYFLTYIDRILIQHFLPLSELGIYGIGYRIMSISSIFISVINISFVPIAYNFYRNENAKPEMLRLYRFVFFISLIIITFISIFTSEILHLFTTPDYFKAYRVIPFLLLSGFFMQFGNLFLGLSIAFKTKLIAFINVAGSLLSIIVNLMLIPYLGILGAAISSAISSMFIFLIQFKYSQKYYYLPIKFKPFFVCFIISLLFMSTNYFIRIDNQGIRFLIKSAFVIIYILLGVSLSKLIRINDIHSVFSM